MPIATTAVVLLSLIGHINADVNTRYAKVPDSCLPAAQAKVTALKANGIDANLMIVHRHGSPDNHAIVHVRFNDTTYYLENNIGTLATRWNSLYDVVSISQGD